MTVIYITFGSDPGYPYGRDQFVAVLGTSVRDCQEAYRREHPNRPGSDSLNYASHYTAKQWTETYEKYYKDRKPEEVIISDTVYGCRPEGFDSLWVAVPAELALIYIQEGSGDNLLPEDLAAGNRDYLECTAYRLESGEVHEEDGGEFMTPYLVQDHYGCMADAISDILDFLYGNPFLEAQILKGIS